MIIRCINCDKKFNVDSELIPNEGRTIQCGSCNHIWFFNKNDQNNQQLSKPIYQKNQSKLLKIKKLLFFQKTGLKLFING